MKRSDFNGLIPDDKLVFLETTASTNDDAKTLLKQGASEGVTVVAIRQTGGRGRQTKSFFSPDTGAYFSVILKPKKIGDAAFLTIYAALAVSDAAKDVYFADSELKWVNDVFLNGRKCAGILTEAQTAADGALIGAVVGIGVNVLPPKGGFPDEIENTAGYLTKEEKEGDRARFIAATVKYLSAYFATDDRPAAIKKYRAKSIVTGKRIKVINPDEVFFATAQYIDDCGRLNVIREDGREETLEAADVSICAQI